MKYLKSFNESEDSFLQNLTQLTDDCLVSLIDEQYLINCSKIVMSYQVAILAPTNQQGSTDQYNNIKDSFIPYIIILSEEYNISDIHIIGTNGKSQHCIVEDIIDDKINDIELYWILIQIKK